MLLRAELSLAEQTQLNMGQPLAVQVPYRAGSPTVRCLTLPEVDALIAEAKRVYAAVIAAIEGAGSRGLQPASTPQLQSPKGK
jgi:hypothetical protein